MKQRPSGAQAPSPAFGRGFRKVVSRKSFARSRGHLHPTARSASGTPAAALLGFLKGLQGIFDRARAKRVERTPPKRLKSGAKREPAARPTCAPSRLHQAQKDDCESDAHWRCGAKRQKKKARRNRAFQDFSIAYLDCPARGSGATLFAAIFLGVDMYPLTAFLSAAFTTTLNKLRARPV